MIQRAIGFASGVGGIEREGDDAEDETERLVHGAAFLSTPPSREVLRKYDRSVGSSAAA